MANLGKVALAMLGILAYQNRDKIGELLRGSDRTGLDRENPQQADGGGLIEQITDTLGSGGGLADVLDRFRQSGSGEQADSWIRQGPNQPVDRQQVEAAIDPETINELSLQTGLSREEYLPLELRVARSITCCLSELMAAQGRRALRPTAGSSYFGTVACRVPLDGKGESHVVSADIRSRRRLPLWCRSLPPAGATTQGRHMHCLDCRKVSGSFFSAFAIWPRTSFVSTGEFATHAGRSFCKDCGGRVFSVTDAEAEIMLGSLDQAPGELIPEYELWVGRREEWMHELPWAVQFQHDREPPDADASGADDEPPPVAQQTDS
jgi:uncharacterized protein YidB (DUF937 family)